MFDIFDLVAKLTLDSSQYDKGLEDAEGNAKGFGSKLATGLGNAAKIGTAAVAAVGTATVVAGKELYKATADVAAYGDQIDKMSQKMGISAEAYQEWDAVMRHSGTSMESLKAGMKTLANAVENGNEAFERLGISQEEIASMSQEDLFSATITALQNVDNETERTYLAGQLLGRGATELGALLNTSAEETQAMKDRVHELGGVMSDEAVKASAHFQDTLQDLQTGFEGLKRNMVGEFLPGITTVMEGLTAFSTGDYDLGAEQIGAGVDNVLATLTEKIPQAIEIGAKIIVAISDSITKNLPKILNAGVEVIKNLLTGINDAAPEILPEALNAILIILQAIIDAAPEIIEGARTIIETVADFILTDGLPMIIEALPDLIIGIVDFILSASTTITESFVTILTAVITAFPDIVVQLVSALPQIITGLISAILKAAPQFSEAMMQLTIASLVIVPMIIVEIIKRLPEIFTAVVDGFKDHWPEMKEAGMDAFMEAVTGMGDQSVYAEIGETIGKLIINAVDKIKSFADQFKEAGKFIIDGLIGGIGSKVTAVTDKVKGIGDAIKGAFTGDLDIHSPSRVFEEYGKFLDLGLVEGITKNLGLVDRAMGSLYDSVEPGSMSTGGMMDYSQITGAMIEALRTVAPELRSNVTASADADGLIRLIVEADRDARRMSGRGLIEA